MKQLYSASRNFNFSHKVDANEVIFSWERVECASDLVLQLRLISLDGGDTFPDKRPVFGEDKVSYALDDFIPCGNYSARLSGEIHNTFFTLAEQEIGVVNPVRDHSQSSEDIQGEKITWNGSECVENNRVNVADNTSGDVVTAEVRIILQTRVQSPKTQCKLIHFLNVL